MDKALFRVLLINLKWLKEVQRLLAHVTENPRQWMLSPRLLFLFSISGLAVIPDRPQPHGNNMAAAHPALSALLGQVQSISPVARSECGWLSLA